MPWFLPIPESWKKRACRYLLQRYVGHFLKEKLSLDQLSVDLFSGRGIIKDLNLDVEALNESLETVNAPIEIIDGFIGSISMAIPWSSLLADSMEVEIKGLELTIQLKECDETDMFLNTASMFSSMTSSLQLAEEVIRSDKSESSSESQPFEGVQMFAQTIESVLSRVKLSFLETIIRLEHLPSECDKGIALELRIERIEYFDDLAKEQGSPVDDPELDNSPPKQPAEALKNLQLMGVSLFCDEFTRTSTKSPEMDESVDISTKLYESALSSSFSGSSTESTHQQSVNTQPQSSAESMVTTSQPIKIAVLTGRQTLKVKVKQNDALSGPKMDVDCQLGAIHIMLSPWQLHGILDMLNNIDTQGSSDRSHSKKKCVRDKLMDSTDYQRVEHQLQKQLQSGRLYEPLAEPNVNYFGSPDNLLHSIEDFNDEPEDVYFSVYSGKKTGTSEMETSMSSINTANSNRTTSTFTTYQHSDSSFPSKSKSPKDNLQKLLDDPAAELSHYRMKISFISLCILHENPSSSPADLFTPEITSIDKLRHMSNKFFSEASRITFSGVNVPLKALRDKFSKIIPHDHIGFLGKPLTVDCTQKIAPRHKTLTADVILGTAEIVECLFDRKTSSSPLHGLSEDPRLANYTELLTFLQNDTTSQYPSTNLHDTLPAVKLHFISGEKTKSSSRNSHHSEPRSKVNVEFGPLQCEVDITIVDRITALLNNDKRHGNDNNAQKLSSNYNQQYNSMLFTQAMDETSSEKLDISVTSQSATLLIRFPKPDLRSSTERLPWWHRNLHKEILILELRNFRFLTHYCSSNATNSLEFTSSEILAFFQEDYTPLLIATITSDDNCDNAERADGFNWPRLVIKTHQASSALETDELGDSNDSTPQDSLNGACQFAKTQPSPFSAKKFMFQQEDLTSISQPEVKHTCEELVLPGNKEELKEFQDKAMTNTKLSIEVFLPNVVAVLHNKQFFELLYNRVNNDLLLWEPNAPSPIHTQEKVHLQQPINLNVLNMLSQTHGQDHFQMAQSGLHYTSDSDSEDDTMNYYSIHENRHKKHQPSEREQQSKMCFSLNIGHGKLLANIPYQDNKKHGEILTVIDEAVLFSAVCHNGDPFLRYLCFQANKLDLSHNGNVGDHSMSGECAIDSVKGDQNRALNPCIRRCERGIPSKLAGQVGRGGDSMDMLTVAVKSKLDTLNNVKEYTISVCVKGGTLHHKMAEPGESWMAQALDLLDVRDYPILGYIEPKVVTQLHLHLWSCSVDYRPLYLPLRAMLTAEAFSISSNIVTGSPTSLLRFQLDDAALYLSDKQFMEVNLKDEYVCVADLERLDLSLKTSDGKNQKFPKTDLRINTNRLNIRTCSDSCRALSDILCYFAKDGDLHPQCDVSDTMTDDESYRDDDTISLTSDISEASSIPSENKMSDSCLQQVNYMMADAMRESTSPPESGSVSPDPTKPGRQIYCVSDEGAAPGEYPRAGLRQLTISPSCESVTSTTSSIFSDDRPEKFSDDEEFCIIDDAGWGIAPRDGEPAVRVFTKDPIVLKENYISPPLGKTDLLKPPDGFPMADYRYTLKELTLIWYMYGGKDFGTSSRHSAKGRERRTSGDSPKPKRFNLPDFGKCLSKEEIPVQKRPSWQTRGGPGRDCHTLMELQLSKVRFQYDIFPQHTEQASRQVLIIHEIEVRDRLASSQMNKFLYQYTSETMPRQTHANMVLIKALHSRPDPNLHSQECALKVSLLPLRLNIDQDSLFFLRTFFIEITGEQPTNPYEVSNTGEKSPVSKTVSSATPAPVMGVNKSPEECPEPDELLIKFDEMTLERDEALQAKLSDEHSDISESENQPVFIKTFIFSPDVHIRLDYHGKRVDMQQGTLAGLLAGLAQLNSSELKLRRLNYRHGLLGIDRVLAYTAHEWLLDIRKNQLPSILGGVGPMHSFVQIVHGIKDLFWLPVEQYKKDGRIVRGLQRGASSFTTSTAMALLELTNKLVQSIQYVAELTYDMLSPGPSVRQHKSKKKYMNQRVRKGQPSDLREGVNNAYIVLKEGFGDAAHNLVRAATEEKEQKGLTGVVGGVLRQIPPTIVQPVIIASEATSKVLGGMRNQLRPESKKEDEEKWREEDK